MRRTSARRRRAKRVGFPALLATALAWLLLAAGVPAAQAQDTHVFDPNLSLTGRCTTDSLDSVPDPGCPYLPPPDGPEPFDNPGRMATDSAGRLYVINGRVLVDQVSTRIDVFDPTGHWILTAPMSTLLSSLTQAYPEFADPDAAFLKDVAVDSLGHLYVVAFIRNGTTDRQPVIRFTPAPAGPPGPGTTFGSPVVLHQESSFQKSLALDSLDRLYLLRDGMVEVYDSAQNGNALLKTGIGSGELPNANSVAVGPAPDFDIYASATKPGVDPIPTPEQPFVSQVTVFDWDTAQVKERVDGSDVPSCEQVNGQTECGFRSAFGQLDVAVDDSNGDLYVGDGNTTPDKAAVYQFRRGGSGEYSFLARVQRSFDNSTTLLLSIVLDNGSLSPNPGYLYATSHSSGIGHVYAFKPKPPVGPPIVSGQQATGISTTEALLQAQVNPNGADTRYRFEYVAEQTYLEDIAAAGPGHGFDHAAAVPAAAVSIGSGAEPLAVSQPLTGLQPGATYRFRVAAENCDPADPDRPCVTKGEGVPGGEGDDARFATYPTPSLPSNCANSAYRTGPSANLPDCRAYELVTPADMNGLRPVAFTIGVATTAWSAPLSSPGGDSVLFISSGGSLPGYDGSGALNADGYRARRDPVDGWRTEAAGPSGAQSQAPNPGSHSADHDYWVWRTFSFDEGSLGPDATYVRESDHTFELVGQGSLGEDPQAQPRWISSGADHIIFSSSVRLEASAPPAGTTAIYDRSPVGPTRVVSPLPGDAVPDSDASYQGASADGRAVAFKVADTLYVRLGDQTSTVSTPPTTFAGFADDGSRLFFVAAGDIFAFDTGTGQTTKIGDGGSSVPVNVSADGTHVYFVTPQQLDGTKGEAGADNLYVWDAATEAIRFIAVLDHRDVTGDDLGDGKTVGGLGLWTSHAVGPDQGQFKGRSSDPARTTPDGEVFVFESRADLTDRGSAGHREIYRYDAATDSLICVSCDPTLAPPNANAKLVKLFDEGGLLNPLAEIANVSSDGRRILFETTAPLVPTDVNGVLDVYEWRAQGANACEAESGCLALISTGQGRFDSHLWATAPDGDDVFIWTSETLLSADKDGGAPSIYDARVDGGFADAVSPPCVGDACKGDPTPPPADPSSGSSSFSGAGNQGKSRSPAQANKKKKCKRFKHRKKHKKCKKKNRRRTK